MLEIVKFFILIWSFIISTREEEGVGTTPVRNEDEVVYIQGRFQGSEALHISGLACLDKCTHREDVARIVAWQCNGARFL